VKYEGNVVINGRTLGMKIEPELAYSIVKKVHKYKNLTIFDKKIIIAQTIKDAKTDSAIRTLIEC
jgi:hypothetical protein